MNENDRIIFEWMNPNFCWHEYAPDRTAWLKKRTFFGLAHTFVSNPDANLCVKCGKDAGRPLQVNGGSLRSTKYFVPEYATDLEAVMEVVDRLRGIWFERDDTETLFFHIMDCCEHGWRVDVEWGHHDGDIPIEHAVGKTLAEALAKICLTMILKEKAL